MQKKEKYKSRQKSGNADDYAAYQIARRAAKDVVIRAKWAEQMIYTDNDDR